MHEFYQRLSYSFGNEDERTERKALQIEPVSRVFCITASGDRPLHLLLDNPQEIVAVDANEIQNHLFHLKAAAIQELDYAEYVSFLGAEPHPHRLQTLERLAHHMPDDAEGFWRSQEEMIAKGVLWQGATEKKTRFWSPMWRLFGSQVNQLFSCETLEEQRAFLRGRWYHNFWAKAFFFILHPNFTRLAIKDPGLYTHHDPNIQIGPYIYQRMIASLENSLAKENALISLIFKGTVGKEAYPPYLTEEGIAQMKGRLNRIHTVTSDAISYLEEAPEGSFDRFSFSDIASYLNQADFERMLIAMLRAAKPGARFCIRQCFSGHRIPKRLAVHFQREPELESALEKEDRAFVYRYLVGTIAA